MLLKKLTQNEFMVNHVIKFNLKFETAFILFYINTDTESKANVYLYAVL